MENLRRLTTVAALALACVGVSAADTISYNTNFGPQATDFTGTMTLPEFNNAGGTLVLTDVTLTLSITDTITDLSLTNNASTSQSFVYTSAVEADDCPATATTCANPFPKGAGPSVSPKDFIDLGSVTLVNDSVTLAAGATTTFSPPNIVTTSTKSLDLATSDPSDISNFIGTGTFTQTAETLTAESFNGGGGNITAAQKTNAEFFATVTYTYGPASTTPEPATLFLMGSALVGVGLLRKRIKS